MKSTFSPTLSFLVLIPFKFVILASVIAYEVNSPQQGDTLLCRQCGHEVSNSREIKNVATKLAKRQRNDTVLGHQQTLIQLLENPAGNQFEVVTVKKGDIYELGEKVEDYSWFPGYAWKIILCPKCGIHLGWSFHQVDGEEESVYSFLGLILSRILHSSYVDSIIVTPKAYQS